MTLPNPGVSLSLLQIYNEAQASPSGTWYNRGTNLGAYRGVQWWKDDASTGYFPNAPISINDFYSKRPTTPVTPGSTVLSGSGSYTIPLYSVMTIVARGSGGGGGGGTGGGGSTGTCAGLGSDGSNGNTTTFGSGTYLTSAPGGTKGLGNSGTGTAGAGSDGTPAGGGGGGAGLAGCTNGGAGGAGGKTILTVYNPISGLTPVGPSVGASISYSCGAGGAGGGGSAGTWCNPYPYCVNASGGSGAAGGNGYIEIYWS